MNAHTAQHFVLTMAVLAILAGQPVIQTVRADDPNALWDTSALVDASWDSATRSITAYNPAEHPDLAPGTTRTAISVSGWVSVLDANDLIAVTTDHAAAFQAFDHDGNEVLFDPNAVTPSPVRTWFLDDRAQVFSVELHLDPNQAYVASLSELTLTIEGLYGQPFTTIDLSVETTEDWVELVPRYRIHVEEVNAVDDTCHIVIREEITDVHSRSSRSFTPSDGIWGEEIASHRDPVRKFSDVDVIVHVGVVDADGNPVDGRRSTSSRGSNGVFTGTREFTFDNCPDTEGLRIRYTIAMDLYEMLIPLTLTEISIPGL